MASTRKPSTKKKPAARATAKRKPAAKISASASKAEHVYTVDELLKRVGGVDESGARALVRGYTDEDLIDLGRRVGTPRIITDARRLDGVVLDVLARLTPAQLGLSTGIRDPSVIALVSGRRYRQHGVGVGQELSRS